MKRFAFTRVAFSGLVVGLVFGLAACGSQPPAPDWQMNAHDSLARGVAAYLSGDARVEASEFARARAATASTGQVAQVARVELTRCAARVASLVFEPCAGFEALRADAAPAERAYADYLAGRLDAASAELLPPQHRAVAGAGSGSGAGAGDAALSAITDPTARLVAAGVLFETGRASPQTIESAIDTASQQGWRRPLLAWLGVQAKLFDAAGQTEAAARVRRRIALVGAPP